MTLALTIAALYLVIGVAVTQELRWAGRTIPSGRGLLVALTWPVVVVLEAANPGE